MPDDPSGLSQHSTCGRDTPSSHRRHFVDWADLLRRCWVSVSDNNVFLASGGVSYTVLVALFPGLAALVSIYGLLLDPQEIATRVNTLSRVLPAETQQMLAEQLHQLASVPSGTLGFSATAGFLLALWSASRGMSGMMSALNMAYERKERRGVIKYNALAITLTFGLIVAGIVAIALIAGLPAAAQFAGLGARETRLAVTVQWPALILLMPIELAVLYRYGPDRKAATWQWLSPGAVIATLLWLIASIGFTAYVANFASYGKTYGSLGGVVVLLTWLYVSALAVLFGAVVNAQWEQNTGMDAKTGEPRPIGPLAHGRDGPADGRPT